MKGKKIITVALILLITICLITTGISAANLIGADSVQYKDTTVKAALDDLMDKVNASACKSGALCSKVKMGDYVSMNPSSTSYSVSKDLTGYSSDQNINPSELNLWRVIDVHKDGTIDMISEYVSSTRVEFVGKTGYLNLVGGLNTIAKQYENSEFTVDSRHMGYIVQTEYITDTSKFTTKAPWTTSTTDNSNESVGGGDVMYVKDTALVSTALGTLNAYVVGTKNSGAYWLASRYYYKLESSWYYDCRIGGNGNGSKEAPLYYCSSGCKDNSYSLAVRPIVILKSDINEVSGSGTSADPWVLG